MKTRPVTSIDIRLKKRTKLNEQTGCIEWTGGKASQGKYPVIGTTRSRCQYAYRVAWELVHGPIPTTTPPDGSRRWCIHHVCKNRRCVNPDHLQLLTDKQHKAAHPARPTHCGHPKHFAKGMCKYCYNHDRWLKEKECCQYTKQA
jgi:hypothetical protein